MKKAIISLVGICLLLGLFGCAGKSAQIHEAEPKIEISLLNELAQADIWVITDTEQNRATTVWGTPTAAKADVSDEAISVSVPESGAYLVRMIDKDGMFYSADSIELAAQQTLVIKGGSAAMTAVVEVYAEDGALIAQYEMFVGRL